MIMAPVTEEKPRLSPAPFEGAGQGQAVGHKIRRGCRYNASCSSTNFCSLAARSHPLPGNIAEIRDGDRPTARATSLLLCPSRSNCSALVFRSSRILARIPAVIFCTVVRLIPLADARNKLHVTLYETLETARRNAISLDRPITSHGKDMTNVYVVRDVATAIAQAFGTNVPVSPEKWVRWTPRMRQLAKVEPCP